MEISPRVKRRAISVPCTRKLREEGTFNKKKVVHRLSRIGSSKDLIKWY